MTYTRINMTMYVQFDTLGRMTPLWFEWHDHRVDIDHIIEVEVRQPEHVSHEDTCVRYTCKIMGKKRIIYFESVCHIWFIEAEEGMDAEPDGDMI